MRILYVIFFVLTTNIIFSQEREIDVMSLKTSDQIDEMEKDLKNSKTNVEVLETCSTNPDWCGTMAFGSTSLVKILNGKYKGNLLHVSVLCGEANYKVNNT